MKRIISFFMLLWLGLLPVYSYAQPIDITAPAPFPVPSAEGAVVIDQRTGKVLFGQNEHKRMYPASTTKVLTALVAIELGNLEDIITVGNEVLMIAWDGSKAGLFLHEEISLAHLIYGLMINSGNDAANTIAVHIARSIAGEELSIPDALLKFAELMNTRAKEAGALDSNFVNPHGYHDINHMTTAYDLAMITRAAMEYPFYREAVSELTMETKYWNNQEPRYWRSKNKLMNPRDKEYYEFATGGKTGWTSHSGSCLISTAAMDGEERVAVVLKSAANQQWKDIKDLLSYGLTNYEYIKLLTKGTIMESLPVENYAPGDWGSLALAVEAEDYGDTILKSDIPFVDKTITFNKELLARPRDAYDTSPRLLAPIHQGQEVGKLTFTLHGETIASSPLTAVRDVRKRTVLEQILPTKTETSSSFPVRTVLLSAIGFLVGVRLLSYMIRYQRRKQRYMYRR